MFSSSLGKGKCMVRSMKTLLSIATICLASSVWSPLGAEEAGAQHGSTESSAGAQGGRHASAPMAFRVLKERVRLRNRPDREAPIIQELHRDDLVLVDGEDADFYSVRPPVDLKAYLFRAYVLDGAVEAQNVNVRLSPSLDAPIVGRLQQGDRVQGEPAGEGLKWLEIPCPDSCRFFVAKDLLEQAGPAELYTRLRHRQSELHRMMAKAQEIVQHEVTKPLEQMRLDEATAVLERVVKDFADFPHQQNKAKQLLGKLQQDYLGKKVAFLEGASEESVAVTQPTLNQFADIGEREPLRMTDRMRLWEPVEHGLIQSWLAVNGGQTPHDFYLEEQRTAQEMVGVLEPLPHNGRHRPGDYVLRKGNVPVAYLYSTVVNLQDQVGHTVKVVGSPRPNHHYAFPAFYVHQLEVQPSE
jgi:hypothetical protein